MKKNGEKGLGGDKGMKRFASFAEMLSHWAEKAPAHPALRYDGACLSFRELEETVETRAQKLREEGKTCLGVLCDGSLECVLTIFAAVRAHRQVVLLDAALPDEQLPGLIRYADIDSLWCGDEPCPVEESDLASGVENGAGKILFFTSGTTERSKAVVLTERSLCASAWNGASMLPLTEDDTLLGVLPLGHVFGFVCGLLWGLSCGACVALGRGARHYIDDFAFYKPSAVSLVPQLLGFLLRGGFLNEELKLILVGAGDCPPSLLRAASDKGLRVSFGYGLTETSSGVAISVGSDPFAMEICPDDTITLAPDGEILVDAPSCIMQGYYKREADTAAVLSGGVLHTGDLGSFDADGRLHITGRKKDILVLGDGTKIFLPEYEASIQKALDRTELAAVLRDGRPLLVVKAEERERAAIEAAIREFNRTLPRGQQITRIQFLSEPLPRTATGKIRRWAIRITEEKKHDA